MKRLACFLSTLLLAAVVNNAGAQGVKQGKSPKISWQRIVLDKNFRSEGVGVADVNKDGKIDVIVGDCWYEAPKDPTGTWKRHILRADRKFDPRVYSESFCVFPDDFNGDGWVDVIVIPFPGAPCYWYENPGSKGGMWKGHLLTNSACNETPIYVDLFKTGKKVLLMGWNPPRDPTDLKKGSYDDRGEMCYFTPGQDPTKPWTKHSISGPSDPKKKYTVPGTYRFSHGLGAGDINKDGRPDVICTGGWWEQPAKIDDKPWKFHRANLGFGCADMYVIDIDADGYNDVVSTAPHSYGMWWHQQKPGKGSPDFFTRELIPFSTTLAQQAVDRKFLGKEETDVYLAINRLRDRQYRKAVLVADPELSRMARDHAERSLTAKPGTDVNIGGKYKGKIVNVIMLDNPTGNADEIARVALEKAEKGLLLPNFHLGIGYAKGKDGMRYTIIIGDRGPFSIPGATHAMHYVDIDGDGLKDLVTGRRYWAHAPNAKGGGGDAGVNDPGYLYWFQARKARDGSISFTPHLIDDDSGVGTSFAVHDMNGDGLLDVIISNKKGVFVFLQVRSKE